MHAGAIFLRQQPCRIAVRMVRGAFIQNRAHTVWQRTHVLIGRDLSRVQHTRALLRFVRVPYLLFVVHGEEEQHALRGHIGIHGWQLGAIDLRQEVHRRHFAVAFANRPIHPIGQLRQTA